jgi:hypothetical protein
MNIHKVNYKRLNNIGIIDNFIHRDLLTTFAFPWPLAVGALASERLEATLQFLYNKSHHITRSYILRT